MAKGIAHVVTKRSGTGGNYDDPSEMKLMFGIGEKTCEQERALTGEGNARVLAEQRQSHGPVTIVSKEQAQRVKNRVMHFG